MLKLIKRGWIGFQNNIEKRMHNASLYKRYGIGWANRKMLKHQSNTFIRKHRSGDLDIYYKNGGELLHGIEEIFVEEIYKSNMKSDPYIIDGGANIGLSVLYFLTQYPSAVVEAFEPDDQNFDLLKKNTDRYNLNLRLYKAALWKENGFVSFNASGSMASKIAETPMEDTEKVEAKRLRDLLIKRVDFLKLDIEGAEYEVVLDIADKLDLVDRVFLEYHGGFEETYKLSDIISLFQKSGFKCYLKEATEVYKHPFSRSKEIKEYDVQLNIFFFK